MAVETSSGGRLFDAHVERFNAGVRTGDFGPMLDAMEPDARLTFRGLVIGPFHGRDAIAAAYREMPPDDEIDVLSVDEPDDATVVARYAWKASRATGTMTMSHNGEAISGLTLAFDPPTGGPALDPNVVRRDFPI